MTEREASRTLLKSPPELWTECSDAESLARHLGEFGEIKITRLEPERTVAWEGECASGTVTLEPSGWGTKVTLTAKTETPEPVLDTTPAPSEPPPLVVPEPEPLATPGPPHGGLLVRMRSWFAPQPPPAPARAPTPEPVIPSPSAPEVPDEAAIALGAALESLGAAHHRPFSRG